jgi:hypothetical protein
MSPQPAPDRRNPQTARVGERGRRFETVQGIGPCRSPQTVVPSPAENLIVAILA